MKQRSSKSIHKFGKDHDLGRSTIYRLISTGQLTAKKVGKRTIITDDDEADWLRRLETFRPKVAL